MALKLLEVAIGLGMIYLLLSMLVTGLLEFWAAAWDKRARVLARGMQAMLGAAAKKVYDHGLVKGLHIGHGPPSYIPSGTFALALLDLVAPGAKTPDQVSQALETRAKDLEPQLAEALRALVNAAEGKMETLRTNVQGWFNAAMDRVSGTYRRSTQWGLVLTSAGVAFLTNVDSIRIANTLLNDDALRQATVHMVEKTIQDPEFQKTLESASQAHLVEPTPEELGGLAPAPEGAATAPAAQPTAGEAQEKADDAKVHSKEVQKKKAEVAQVKIQKSLATVTELGMPIGWGSASARQYFKDHWLLSILGLMVTAVASAQGAPFWFDLLSRFVGLRSTVKPMAKRKKDDEGEGEAVST